MFSFIFDLFKGMSKKVVASVASVAAVVVATPIIVVAAVSGANSNESAYSYELGFTVKTHDFVNTTNEYILPEIKTADPEFTVKWGYGDCSVGDENFTIAHLNKIENPTHYTLFAFKAKFGTEVATQDLVADVTGSDGTQKKLTLLVTVKDSTNSNVLDNLWSSHTDKDKEVEKYAVQGIASVRYFGLYDYTGDKEITPAQFIEQNAAGTVGDNFTKVSDVFTLDWSFNGEVDIEVWIHNPSNASARAIKTDAARIEYDPKVDNKKVTVHFLGAGTARVIAQSKKPYNEKAGLYARTEYTYEIIDGVNVDSFEDIKLLERLGRYNYIVNGVAGVERKGMTGSLASKNGAITGGDLLDYIVPESDHMGLLSKHFVTTQTTYPDASKGGYYNEFEHWAPGYKYRNIVIRGTGTEDRKMYSWAEGTWFFGSVYGNGYYIDSTPYTRGIRNGKGELIDSDYNKGNYAFEGKYRNVHSMRGGISEVWTRNGTTGAREKMTGQSGNLGFEGHNFFPGYGWGDIYAFYMLSNKSILDNLTLTGDDIPQVNDKNEPIVLKLNQYNRIGVLGTSHLAGLDKVFAQGHAHVNGVPTKGLYIEAITIQNSIIEKGLVLVGAHFAPDSSNPITIDTCVLRFGGFAGLLGNSYGGMGNTYAPANTTLQDAENGKEISKNNTLSKITKTSLEVTSTRSEGSALGGLFGTVAHNGVSAKTETVMDFNDEKYKDEKYYGNFIVARNVIYFDISTAPILSMPSWSGTHIDVQGNDNFFISWLKSNEIQFPEMKDTTSEGTALLQGQSLNTQIPGILNGVFARSGPSGSINYPNNTLYRVGTGSPYTVNVPFISVAEYSHISGTLGLLSSTHKGTSVYRNKISFENSSLKDAYNTDNAQVSDFTAGTGVVEMNSGFQFAMLSPNDPRVLSHADQNTAKISELIAQMKPANSSFATISSLNIVPLTGETKNTDTVELLANSGNLTGHNVRFGNKSVTGTATRDTITITIGALKTALGVSQIAFGTYEFGLFGPDGKQTDTFTITFTGELAYVVATNQNPTENDKLTFGLYLGGKNEFKKIVYSNDKEIDDVTYENGLITISNLTAKRSVLTDGLHVIRVIITDGTTTKNDKDEDVLVEKVMLSLTLTVLQSAKAATSNVLSVVNTVQNNDLIISIDSEVITDGLRVLYGETSMAYTHSNGKITVSNATLRSAMAAEYRIGTHLVTLINTSGYTATHRFCISTQNIVTSVDNTNAGSVNFTAAEYTARLNNLTSSRITLGFTSLNYSNWTGRGTDTVIAIYNEAGGLVQNIKRNGNSGLTQTGTDIAYSVNSSSLNGVNIPLNSLIILGEGVFWVEIYNDHNMDCAKLIIIENRNLATASITHDILNLPATGFTWTTNDRVFDSKMQVFYQTVEVTHLFNVTSNTTMFLSNSAFSTIAGGMKTGTYEFTATRNGQSAGGFSLTITNQALTHTNPQVNANYMYNTGPSSTARYFFDRNAAADAKLTVALNGVTTITGLQRAGATVDPANYELVDGNLVITSAAVKGGSTPGNNSSATFTVYTDKGQSSFEVYFTNQSSTTGRLTTGGQNTIDEDQIGTLTISMGSSISRSYMQVRVVDENGFVVWAPGSADIGSATNISSLTLSIPTMRSEIRKTHPIEFGTYTVVYWNSNTVTNIGYHTIVLTGTPVVLNIPLQTFNLVTQSTFTITENLRNGFNGTQIMYNGTVLATVSDTKITLTADQLRTAFGGSIVQNTTYTLVTRRGAGDGTLLIRFTASAMNGGTAAYDTAGVPSEATWNITGAVFNSATSIVYNNSDVTSKFITNRNGGATIAITRANLEALLGGFISGNYEFRIQRYGTGVGTFNLVLKEDGRVISTSANPNFIMRDTSKHVTYAFDLGATVADSLVVELDSAVKEVSAVASIRDGIGGNLSSGTWALTAGKLTINRAGVMVTNPTRSDTVVFTLYTNAGVVTFSVLITDVKNTGHMLDSNKTTVIGTPAGEIQIASVDVKICVIDGAGTLLLQKSGQSLNLGTLTGIIEPGKEYAVLYWTPNTTDMANIGVHKIVYSLDSLVVADVANTDFLLYDPLYNCVYIYDAQVSESIGVKLDSAVTAVNRVTVQADPTGECTVLDTGEWNFTAGTLSINTTLTDTMLIVVVHTNAGVTRFHILFSDSANSELELPTNGLTTVTTGETGTIWIDFGIELSTPALVRVIDANGNLVCYLTGGNTAAEADIATLRAALIAKYGTEFGTFTMLYWADDMGERCNIGRHTIRFVDIALDIAAVQTFDLDVSKTFVITQGINSGYNGTEIWYGGTKLTTVTDGKITLTEAQLRAAFGTELLFNRDYVFTTKRGAGEGSFRLRFTVTPMNGGYLICDLNDEPALFEWTIPAGSFDAQTKIFYLGEDVTALFQLVDETTISIAGADLEAVLGAPLSAGQFSFQTKRSERSLGSFLLIIH